VIDHLGTVSSKFEHKMEEKTEITQMEEKLNLLKQVTFFSLEKKSLTDRNISPLEKTEITQICVLCWNVSPVS
jgi:hypothetical protein